MYLCPHVKRIFFAYDVPVAAYSDTGPNNLVIDGVTGSLNQDLDEGIGIALHFNFQDTQEKIISSFVQKPIPCNY